MLTSQLETQDRLRDELEHKAQQRELVIMKKHEKQIDCLNEELETSETDRKKLAEELALAVEGGKADKEELMSKIERLLADLSATQASESDLRDSLEDSRTKLEASSKEISLLKAALEDEKQNVAELRASSSSSSKELMNKLAERESVINGLEERSVV